MSKHLTNRTKVKIGTQAQFENIKSTMEVGDWFGITDGLYRHDISLQLNSTNKYIITLIIFTNSNTAFTYETLKTYLQTNYGNNPISVSGSVYRNSVFGVICQAVVVGGLFYTSILKSNGVSDTYILDTPSIFGDAITQIY